MDSGQALQIFIVLGLLALSAFFSSSETAMMAVNKIRIRNLADAGLSSAQTLMKVLDNQPKMLSAILIGNNIVNISASSLSTIVVTRAFGDMYVGVGTGILTLLVLIFGEITPKTSATLYSETMALRFAKPIYMIMQVLTPVIFIVDKLSQGVLRLLHVDPNKKQDAITEDELRTIVEVSHEEGVIESDEKIASFVLPLGMTINMNGTAIMQVVATLFVAGCAGYDVTFGQLVVVALLVLIASVGTPAAPGAGAIILFTILSGLGYVNDSALLAYSLILAINRPIEMLLTALNVVGDSAASIYVAKSEGMLDETKYNA